MQVLLWTAALLASVFSQSSSSCSFSDASGYSLQWTTSNGNINFNLTYRNFPTNSFTGVGFGDNMNAGLDVILVQMSGFQVQVVPANAMGYQPPTPDANKNSVTTRSASFRDNTLRAEFSRPLTANGVGKKSLSSGCMTWNFLVAPGTYNNGQYGKHASTPRQMQVCNVDQNCRQGGLMQTMRPSQQISQNSYGDMVQTTTPSNMYSSQNQQNNQQNQYNTNQQRMFDSPNTYNQNNQNQNQYQSNTMYQNQNTKGQNFGYVANTAIPPPSRPYTGQSFVYTTTANPTQADNNGRSFENTNSILYDSRQNPSSSNYNQNQNMNQQYQGNQYQNQQNQNQQRMYDSSNQNNMNQNQYQQGNQQGYQATSYNADSNSQYNPQQSNSYLNQNSNQYNQNQNQNMNQQPYYGSSQGYQSPYGPRQQFSSMPVLNYQTPQQYPVSYQQNSYLSHFQNRKKRQSGYQPTNNIYGYDVNSNSQGGAPLVVNPNYKYLSGPLADEYSKTYADAARMYDQGAYNTQQGVGSANQGMNLNGNLPVLSNSQQNQQNYQEIQRDYASNPNPTAGQTYTNNPYGYDYVNSGSPPPQNVYYNPPQVNNQQLLYSATPNPNLYYPANPNGLQNVQYDQSTMNRQFDQSQQNGQYQSSSNLKQTRLRDDSNNQQAGTGIYRDQVYYDTNNPNQSMYFPYRTSTTQQSNPTTVNNFNSNSNGVQYDAVSGRMRDGSDPCSLEDPYWCDYYVGLYLGSQTQYEVVNQQTACQGLRSSLQDSYNGCCKTVKLAGC